MRHGSNAKLTIESSSPTFVLRSHSSGTKSLVTDRPDASSASDTRPERARRAERVRAVFMGGTKISRVEDRGAGSRLLTRCVWCVIGIFPTFQEEKEEEKEYFSISILNV